MVLACGDLFPVDHPRGIRTYYLKRFFGTPPLPSMLVHLHGAAMTTWVALFVTQMFLIRTKNLKAHQKLGIAAVGLSVVVIVVGVLTAIAAAKNGSSVPNIPPLGFLDLD